ncbi:MAG: protein kinase [Muribaculaceae bacterium]|nr:protein kinase [Muribaculaceae bacterium]
MSNNSVDGNSMLRVGTLLRRIYRIDGYLASGGFGNTYVATNVEFDEQVAVKEFFMKGLTQRNVDSPTIRVTNAENMVQFEKLRNVFKREARRLRRIGKLNNPHIVKVYDIFEENNTTYYVMQFINGSSFSELLKMQNAPCDSNWLLEVFLPQVLDALQELHENKIWHLDIKPANIMADAYGNIMLIDFGSSKQVDPNSGDPDTISSFLLITRPYAPIELKEYDYKKIGPWTDLFSLGATLYNLATLQRPPRASEITVDGEAAFKFLPQTNETFKKLVMWMMSTNIDKRPQSVAEVNDFLHECKEGTLKSKEEEGDSSANQEDEKKDSPLNVIGNVPITGAAGGSAAAQTSHQSSIPTPSGQDDVVVVKSTGSRNKMRVNKETGTTDDSITDVAIKPGNTSNVPSLLTQDGSQGPVMPPIAPPANLGGQGMNSNGGMNGQYGSTEGLPFQRHPLSEPDSTPPPAKRNSMLIVILSFIAACLLTGIALFFVLRGDGGNTSSSASIAGAREVKDTLIKCEVRDSIVTYTYSGPIVNSMPNGRGKGVYEDGKYEGPYEDGVREGDSCKFTFTKNTSTDNKRSNNGDVYEGSFDDDLFDGDGVYTEKHTGYKYKGTFDDGKKDDGQWYNNKGKLYSIVENGSEKLATEEQKKDAQDFDAAVKDDKGKEKLDKDNKDKDADNDRIDSGRDKLFKVLYIVVPLLLFLIAGGAIFFLLRKR